jgi:hypothetical protein
MGWGWFNKWGVLSFTYKTTELELRLGTCHTLRPSGRRRTQDHQDDNRDKQHHDDGGHDGGLHPPGLAAPSRRRRVPAVVRTLAVQGLQGLGVRQHGFAKAMVHRVVGVYGPLQGRDPTGRVHGTHDVFPVHGAGGAWDQVHQCLQVVSQGLLGLWGGFVRVAPEQLVNGLPLSRAPAPRSHGRALVQRFQIRVGSGGSHWVHC